MYTDIIKIPCNEIYTKADFTFTCRKAWDTSISSATVTSLSKTFNKKNIGTYEYLAILYNSKNQEEDLIIGIKKYDGYYTLSLGACTTGLYMSPYLSLFPLSDTADDKTIFRCVLYN